MGDELARALELLQFPFMQRALVGGVLTGLMGGLLGSLAIARQLSFFSNALGHSALLGLGIGLLLGVDPTFTLLPFAVCFAVAAIYLIEHTQLWTDSLLNIMHSSFLAIAIIALNYIGQYKGGLNQLLFGDILAVQVSDLILSAVLFAVCVAFVGLTLRAQTLLTLHEPLAIARGVAVSAQRTAFIILLALVVSVSIETVGALLVSAFIVIPACAARLLSRNFATYIWVSTVLGGLSAIAGIVLSVYFDLPSGPTIVVAQLAVFLLTMLVPRTRAATS